MPRLKLAAIALFLAATLAPACGWAEDVAKPAASPAAASPASADPAPAAPAPAKEPPAPSAILPPEVNSTIAIVVGTMEGAEKTLTAITTVDTDLGRLRDDIDGVIAQTTSTADGLRPQPRRHRKPDQKNRHATGKGRTPRSSHCNCRAHASRSRSPRNLRRRQNT